MNPLSSFPWGAGADATRVRRPSRPTLRNRWLGLALLLGLAGCPAEGCGTPEGPPAEDAIGAVSVRDVTGGVEVVLADLEVPLRSFQVDVAINGAVATRAFAAGAVEHDVVEAGLGGTTRSELTLVVGDTRRILLDDGAVARLDLDGAGSVELSNAIAVDEEGRRRALETP